MTWRYEQSTGYLFAPDGTLAGSGYAGHGIGLDNPDAQDMHDVGPLPQGKYTIGPAYTSRRCGPVTMDLRPDPANDMFGRFAFRLHGDLIDGPPNSASDGCVILGRMIRQQIAESPDREFLVVAGMTTA